MEVLTMKVTPILFMLFAVSLLVLTACGKDVGTEVSLVTCPNGSLVESMGNCVADKVDPPSEPGNESQNETEIPEESGPIIVPLREVERVAVGKDTEDGLVLGQEYCQVLDNSDLEGLYDGDLKVDAEDYNAEERLEYCVTVDSSSTGDSDLGSDVALTYGHGDILYYVELEDFDTDKVSAEDPLKFNFLGLPAQITKWEGNKVTFVQGYGQYVEEGQIFEDIRLVAVADGRAVVEHIEEDGFTVAVDEHDIEVVGKREVYVDDVLYLEKEGSTSAAFMFVSAEETPLLRSVSNGEEYDNDPNWDWIVSSQDGDYRVGLEWDVDARDADDDHTVFLETPITLVNGWLELALEEDDLSEQRDYEFEIEQENVNDSDVVGLKVRGAFDSNLGEVEESDDGVFLDLERNITWVHRSSEWELASWVNFKDTSVSLEHLGGVVEFEAVEMSFIDNVMTALTYSGESLATEEDDFLATRGYVLRDPEGNFEDSQLRVEGFPEDTEEYSVVFRTPIEA